MASPALIAAALAVLAPHGPESPLAVAKKLNAAYKKAILGKDAAYFEKNSTEDFVYITASGRTEKRAQALSEMKQGFAAFKAIKSLDVKIVSARRTEGGILIVSDTKMDATMEMGNKSAHLVSVGRDEALVVPAGKNWIYKRIKMLKDDTKIDGKPMKM